MFFIIKILAWKKSFSNFKAFVFLVFQRHGSLGDLLFSISYLPTAERLTIVIMKARNLKTMDISGSAGKWMDLSLAMTGDLGYSLSGIYGERGLHP